MPVTGLLWIRRAGLGVCALLLCAARPAAADDTLSLVLGGKTPSLMNTLNLVAEGAGFYKEEHLKVTLTLEKGSPEATRACSDGRFDICPIGIEPLITRYAQGERLKMFLSRAVKFTYVFGVLQDSPITRLADFKGKAIGVHSQTGASAILATESALAASGLTPSDHMLVTIGKEDEAIAALSSGKVAGAALPYYEFIPYIVAGRNLRFIPHPTLGDVTNSGYAASPKVMAAKREPIRRFSRAIVKSSLLIRYNPQAAARAWLRAQGSPFTEADVQRKTAELDAWEPYLPAANPEDRRIGAVTETGIQTYIDVIRAAGVTKDPPRASEVVSGDFVEYANDFDRAAFEKRAKAMR